MLLLVLLVAFASLTSGFSTSIYLYSTVLTEGFGVQNVTLVASTTGDVTPVSSELYTSIYSSGVSSAWDKLLYAITWSSITTNFFLTVPTSICFPPQQISLSNMPSCSTTPTQTAGPAILTRVFAPMLVTPPASCTDTSFSYTSSKCLNPDTQASNPLTSIAGDPDQLSAVLITTYVFTPSTDVSGVGAATTYCDVFLKPGAVEGPNALTAQSENTYLSQCIDPSSYLCAGSTSTLGGCQSTTGPIVYPPQSFAGNGVATGGSGRYQNAAQRFDPTAGESMLIMGIALVIHVLMLGVPISDSSNCSPHRAL
ncbi:hypothetical protein GQ53DRAFT_818196 [Thozetella sp. PMI_491]|nr:hypothetical protein GQ53DRAFT_818196 [Thozetella sp. PMI_491]